jgi:hypothetical protein
MNAVTMRRFALLAAVAAALALVPQPTAPPGLAAEMDRVRSEATAGTPEDQRAGPAARLDRARAALAAGRPLLALYLFEMPWESARAWTFVTSSSGITTPDAFVEKWTAAGEPRVETAGAADRRRPLLLDAVAAAAEARGPTTYHASRAYGEDAGVAAGLYYLGDSRAVMQFARFVRELQWPVTAAAPALRAITAELNALDADMTKAYETMDPASHPSYISASAALKQAKTLNERGQHAGALFQYLLARYVFAPLRGPAGADATAERIAAARAALPAGDHSVAELFLQLADEGVSGGQPAQRRGAAAVIEDVLPAYLAAIVPAATTTAAPAAARVTVTLVRWPYT